MILPNVILPKTGMGTWQLGGATTFGGRQTGWGGISDEQADAVLGLALDHGVRLFDTADAYGHGLSEQRLGRHIGHRDDVVLVSKFGQREAAGAASTDFSAAWLALAVEASLRRLRREQLDVLLLHSPDERMDFVNYDQEPLLRLRRAGKIRAFGISARSRWGALNALRAGFGSVIQLIYSALDRRAEAEVFPLARANHVSIMARCVLGSGFLVPDSKAVFEATDHRAAMPGEQVAWLNSQRENLRWMQDFPGGMVVSALRFALSNTAVATALLGVSRPEQVQSLVLASELGPLNEAEQAKVRASVPETYPGWA